MDRETEDREQPSKPERCQQPLEARAQQAIAVGNFFPQTQQATGGYSRVGLSRTAANNPSFLGDFIPASTLATIPANAQPTNWYSAWTAGFNMSWELDFWGRFRRAIESANATLDTSVENFDSALVTLLADVATNYVQYRVAQERLKIEQRLPAAQDFIREHKLNEVLPGVLDDVYL